MPKYQVSFIVEQVFVDDVEADSPEEALEKHNTTTRSLIPCDWSEVQPNSYEVEEIK